MTEQAALAPSFEYALARPQSPLRDAITAATRIPEPQAVASLIAAATLSSEQRRRARAVALELATKVRAERRDATGADALIQAFALSSEEGIALMCLAEALLRIPDADTADALIRDKIGRGDWRAHAGLSDSVFVNAACWGLVVTGKLVAKPPDTHALSRALTGVLERVGEPVIRAAMRAAMRFLGEQFVLGETIEAALERAQPREARGFRYSYDMLGEAALTERDAQRYFESYERALHAIGRRAQKRGVVDGPGISVKLSALHPRFVRAQRDRVVRELLPRVATLARLAKDYDIGFNIDAEEADRLELSLDLIEALARDPTLADWSGLGFVVQTYQKRAPLVVYWLVELANDCGRRLMVRLVKGAYWDSEIKRAQVEGLADYPVFTRKVHTDISYLACARTLLERRDLIYPQFATHNAATLAAVLEIAGNRSGFEFQCLHGMGESLYDHVVGAQGRGVATRIYAPVGTHETLLAYLVRRLLENGANTSFVNQVVDLRIDLERLVTDPLTLAEPFARSPHPRIPLPPALYADRRNSRGVDFSDEHTLAALESELNRHARASFIARPIVHGRENARVQPRPVAAPADLATVVGQVVDATVDDIALALDAATRIGRGWSEKPSEERARVLEDTADRIEANAAAFVHLAVREAGKTLQNAMGEVREAADFCRYYAAEIRGRAPAPALGPIVAISPWNFPLAIFVGQIAGALAGGNPVLAKPAEQTPLTAFHAVRLFHEAGVPLAALQFLPGAGDTVGAALVQDARIAGVVFTGSTDVATGIHRALAQRGNPALIAETGGQNAMIVDASALPEQVVADALTSAFDSAGQRCSALRVLCLQDSIADRVIDMLAGAMQQLRVDDPAKLATDIGPIIDGDALRGLRRHVAHMDREARRIAVAPLDPAVASRGHFLAPVACEIDSLDLLTGEVFGPVLHVLRWRASELVGLVDAIDATGYALTLGIHSRIDETIDRIVQRSRAGNVYVNRNMIGAVVGVQPFGGDALSGTGPKAGGPFYVHRLTRDPGDCELATRELPGPTGEENTWRPEPRGRIVALGGAMNDAGVWRAQARAALAVGNTVSFAPSAAAADVARAVAGEDSFRHAAIEIVASDLDWAELPGLRAAIAADASTAAAAARRLAARDGARLPVIEPVGDPPRYPLARLCVERTVSINTTAAGGNASLVAAMD